MANYRIEIKPSAAREIEDVGSKQDRQRIVAPIRSLAATPRPPGYEKMAGQARRYRIRIGRYRVVYSIRAAFPMSLTVPSVHRRIELP